MNVSTSGDRTIEWAVKLFRPLMQKLDMQNLGSDHHAVLTSLYMEMFKYNMDRCVIIVQRVNFDNPHKEGVSVWQYNNDNNVHALYIFLNDNLYTSSAENINIKRKAVTTHEFTHCTAFLMTISRIASPLITKNQIKKLREKTHQLMDSDIEKILADIMQPPLGEDDEDRLLSFPDGHFRTGSEDFLPSYRDLYRNLLLSYELFREFFTDEVMKQFAFAPKVGAKSATKILSNNRKYFVIKKFVSKIYFNANKRILKSIEFRNKKIVG